MTFCSLSVLSQELEITIKEKPPYKVFEKILVKVNLKNTTNKPLTYFDSRFTSWGSFKEQWQMKIDGKPADLNFFQDAYEGKYKSKTIITLQPGQSKSLGGQMFKLKSPGHYKISYTQKQSPSYVKKEYAKSLIAYKKSQKINTFEVKGKVEFDVKDIKTKSISKKVEMSYEEWKEYKKEKVYDGHYFTDIDKALKNPQKVFYLQIGCEGLSKNMINRIGQLKNLKSLSLYSFNQESLPFSIAELDLFELTIIPTNNQNIAFPEEFANNETLRILKTKSFGKISKEILKLKNLKNLDISKSSLASLPDMSSLQNLEKLKASSIDLKNCNEANLDKIKSLKILDLGYNKKLNRIDFVTECKNLEILELNSCNIQHLPKNIDSLSNLKELSLAINNLKKLPSTIGNLTTLEHLKLSFNKELEKLPSSFVNLENLKHLNISNTGVRRLPEGFSELPLEKIILVDTRIKRTKDYRILKRRLGDNFRK